MSSELETNFYIRFNKIEMNMHSPFCVGIDIGGTNTAFAFVDQKGAILHKDVVPTGSSSNPSDLINRVSDKIHDAIKSKSSFEKLKGIGIGAPNGNFFNGTIEFAPNLNWFGIIPVAKMFSEQFKNIPAYLTNDANAAALGEMYFGGAKKIKDFIFITLGTGLGSGIVVDGKLVYGHDGFAGEIGHTIVIQNGRQCGCGRKGCLEQYCSATGLVKTYLEILLTSDAYKKTDLDHSAIDAKFIFDRALVGEEMAINAFDYTGEILGFALANSVAYTSPKAIFLFGGLANSGELLIKPTVKSFQKNLLNIYKNKVEIYTSSLPENDAALLGAASLAWNEIN